MLTFIVAASVRTCQGRSRKNLRPETAATKTPVAQSEKFSFCRSRKGYCPQIFVDSFLKDV